MGSGMPGTNIPSPCVDVCKMEDGLCTGCQRTVEEITEWGRATEERRLAIWEQVIKRRKAASGERKS